jgi:hypothetical protein
MDTSYPGVNSCSPADATAQSGLSSYPTESRHPVRPRRPSSIPSRNAVVGFVSRKSGRAFRCRSKSELKLLGMLEVCDLVDRFEVVSQFERPEAKPALRPLLPAVAIRWRSGSNWIAPTRATTPAGAETCTPAQVQSAVIESVVSGVHLVFVTDDHLALVDHRQVERVRDMRRRARSGLQDRLTRIEDDLLSEHVQRTLRMALGCALRDAPSTRVCKQLGLSPCNAVCTFSIPGDGARTTCLACAGRGTHDGRLS